MSVSMSVSPKSTPRFGRLTPHFMGKLRMILASTPVLEEPMEPVKQSS